MSRGSHGPAIQAARGIQTSTRLDLARGLVDSREWIDVQATLDARARAELVRRLDRLYFGWIERLMGFMNEVRLGNDGRARVLIRPFGVPTALRLGPARLTSVGTSERSERAVEAGWLVARPSGQLALEASELDARTQRIAVDLRDFAPRLLGVPAIGHWFYLGFQSELHVRVSRALLLRDAVPLARRLAAAPTPPSQSTTFPLPPKGGGPGWGAG